ncbi:hypothetical protein [Burkholderia sp. 8Y]|uniref:hypothetical protein n=1 Tax=Burkholderia sp. 8Y TaxID=2653133 RepID=UPI0013581CB8|nr:hypothetical protein [Burkholderia sp. 8Y]
MNRESRTALLSRCLHSADIDTGWQGGSNLLRDAVVRASRRLKCTRRFAQKPFGADYFCVSLLRKKLNAARDYSRERLCHRRFAAYT